MPPTRAGKRPASSGFRSPTRLKNI
ncbi:hypothetical protein ACVXG9_07005 [Escherichia coli]